MAEILLETRGVHVCRGLEAVGDRTGASRAGRGQEAFGVPVIEVDHPRLAPRLGRVLRAHLEALEEAQLGGRIGRGVAMELEVLMGQVREHRHVVGDAPDALLRQAVRAGLDDGPVIAGGDHRREVRLELGRLRGGRSLRVAQRAAADDHLDRAQQAGRLAGRLEHGPHEVGRRRLAVGARDAHHAQRPGGMLEPPRRRGRERRPRRVDEELRHTEARQGPFDDQRTGAVGDRLGGEFVAVRHAPGERHEDLPGRDPPRVTGDPAHGPPRERRCPRRALEAHHGAQQAEQLELRDQPAQAARDGPGTLAWGHAHGASSPRRRARRSAATRPSSSGRRSRRL